MDLLQGPTICDKRLDVFYYIKNNNLGVNLQQFRCDSKLAKLFHLYKGQYVFYYRVPALIDEALKQNHFDKK